MIAGVRQKAVVGEGGKIELSSPELPQGALVEVIVLVEPAKQDTTEYLSSDANRNHLLQALLELDDSSGYVYVEAADL